MRSIDEACMGASYIGSMRTTFVKETARDRDKAKSTISLTVELVKAIQRSNMALC